MAKPNSTPNGSSRERSDFRSIVETRLITCPCEDADCDTCKDWLAMSEALDVNLRYEDALMAIADLDCLIGGPNQNFVARDRMAQAVAFAKDALGMPPSALHVEAQPGSEVLCPRCAHVFCPHDDRLHFHHDGCPSCDANDHPLLPSCVIGEYCHRHQFIHGAEAEELRSKIEELLESGAVSRQCLRALLDKVDARDSIALVEAGAEERPAETHERCDCAAHEQLREAHAREQVKRMREAGMRTGLELGGHMCMCGHCSHSHFKCHPHVRDGCSACNCTEFVPIPSERVQ